MNRHRGITLGILIALLSGGCNEGLDSTLPSSRSTLTTIHTVQIHINGFQKSRSGAT